MASDVWVAAITSGELPANQLTRVDVGADPALLYRLGDAIFAISNRCTHAGMVLDRAPVESLGADAEPHLPGAREQVRPARREGQAGAGDPAARLVRSA